MASLAIMLVVLAFSVFGIAVAAFASSAVLERYWWRRVASHLDGRLQDLGLKWDKREAWRGCWRGRTVAARLYPTDAGVGLRVYMQVPTGTLRVRARQGWSRWSWARRIGDAPFDGPFVVDGSPADRAYLTGAVRELVLSMGGALQIQGGWLTWDETRPVALDPASLEGRFQRLVRLSDALWAVDRDPVDRLEHAVLDDPNPRVRRRGLLALHRRMPREAERLAFRGLMDRDPTVRWAAARIARTPGPLMALCVDGSLPLTLRRAAGAELLTMASSSRHIACARALAPDPEPAMQRLAARLAAQAGRAAEPVLLALLRHGHRSVVGYAARGLSRWGGVESARPLRARLREAPAGWARVELWLAWRAVAARTSCRVGSLAVSAASGGELALIAAPDRAA